jgi:hypothetical protein
MLSRSFMNIRLLFLLGFVFLSIYTHAQKRVKLSGQVTSAENGEPLFGVSVFIQDTRQGVSTNMEGAYLLELDTGTYQLHYSYLGYQKKSLLLELKTDQTVSVALEPSLLQTEEVMVSSRRVTENLDKTVDNISISREEIKKLPYLLGEVDPIKTLQLLPGVQSNGEGNNGLFVRGGGVDQNLILLDQAPVYNTGHLFGFFSLFNHAVLKNVNLIKGGIPARYGGRLSSILEIKTRAGSFKQFKGEGSLGVVSGNLMLEGPLARNKSSFIVSGRRTYIDLLSKTFTKDPTIFNTGLDYFFDDLNARIDYKPGPKDQLSLSGFSGTDDFSFQGKNSLSNTIRWKNYTSSLEWDHFYNEEDYLTVGLFASSYKMNFSASINEYVFSIFSSIEDYGARATWVIGSLPNHSVSFGAEYIRHGLVPNNMKANGADVSFTFTEQEKLHNQEQALFVQDEIQISSKLSMAAGLRFSSYQQLGPFTSYITDEGLTIVDTLSYRPNTVIQAYWNIDPRLSFNFRLKENASLKASYDRMHQYLHMAPVSSVSLPTDVWVPSSARLKPQRASQYSLGYFRNFPKQSLETSASAYYKSMNRQIEYRDGVIVGYSKGHNYDDSFIFGTGSSYGLELFLKKDIGKLTGWLSYTLSRTTRKFDDINQGNSFAAKYDRLHNFSWVNAYQLNERWSFSGVFTYSTGNALTLPVGRYIINGNIINEYSGRNTFRMPPYHRLDLSATYTVQKRKNFESYWVFSVYNAYNRKNPYYIYFDTKGNVNDYYLEVSLEKVSLFPIIPSVAYQFKF